MNDWYSYVQAIYAGINIASTSFNTFNTCFIQREEAIETEWYKSFNYMAEPRVEDTVPEWRQTAAKVSRATQIWTHALGDYLGAYKSYESNYYYFFVGKNAGSALMTSILLANHFVPSFDLINPMKPWVRFSGGVFFDKE